MIYKYGQPRSGKTLFFIREEIKDGPLSTNREEHWAKLTLIGMIEDPKELFVDIIVHYIGPQEGLLKKLKAANVTFTPVT